MPFPCSHRRTFSSGRKLWCIGAAVLWQALAGGGAWAADGVETPPLTPIAELPPLDAAPTAKAAVRISGSVTLADPAEHRVFISDATGGTSVELKPGEPVPRHGSRVEVVGTVRADSRMPAIAAESLRVTGGGPMPTPVRASLAEANSMKHPARWIEVEATFIQAHWGRGVLLLHLLDLSDLSFVIVESWPRERFPRDWCGGRVRIRGVNVTEGQRSIRVPGFEHVELLRPGTSDPFLAPLSTFAQWRGAGRATTDRYRFEGIFLGRTPDNSLLLRDNSGAARVAPALSYVATAPDELVTASYPIPELKPGDRVELVGSPIHTTDHLRLRNSHFRNVQPGEPLLPVPITVRSALSGQSGCDLVTLTGRLTNWTEISQPGPLWRQTITLASGRQSIDATLESPRKSSLASLKSDDLIEVTGLLFPTDGTPAWRIVLASPGDARSLGLAPEIVRRRRWRVAGAIGALAAGAGAWIIRLRRRLRRERRLADERARASAAVSELNATLENRVAERTAELENTKLQLQRALEHERELGDLKSRFVTMVSHEFRTPLGITMSAVELLRHYNERLPEAQQQELLEDIHRSTRHMGGLMEQVLVLGRVEAGTVGFRPAPIDLDGLARRLTDESLSATSRKCPIEWTPHGDLDGAAGDETFLRHIFSNLLSNAVKYSPEGTPVEFSARRDGADALFSVVDHGLGIPESDLPRLFEAFHRGGNVGEIPGTGLGLVIVKRCIDLHKGSIAIDSTPGAGTTVTVRLPMWEAIPPTPTPMLPVSAVAHS